MKFDVEIVQLTKQSLADTGAIDSLSGESGANGIRFRGRHKFPNRIFSAG